MPEEKRTSRRRGLERIFDDERMDPEAVEELSEFLAQRKVDARQRWSEPDAVATLKTACAALQIENHFEVGDVVRWKDGLKNKNIPAYGVPGVVVEVLAEPISNPEGSAGSTYFREPLDLVLGLYVESDGGEDTISMYHFDSRRFEAHPDFQ
jgi:hypothetical protein